MKTITGAATTVASSNALLTVAFGESFDTPANLASGTVESDLLDTLPSKLPLIKRSFRPPNYETPLTYFNELYTPNKAFFVRYHLSNIPRIDLSEWRLSITGDAVDKPLELTIPKLKKKFKQVEIAAVNQCAGNRRGLVEPHVPGIQWHYGAMGNARWRGVRLKDVLEKAGVKQNALEVIVGGSDSGLTVKMPDFVKSLPLWKAMDENTLIAFEMNGEPIPHWNGYPARLIVPGWTGTYWMKHLNSIEVSSKPFEGFWMRSAYRVPKGVFQDRDAFQSQTDETSEPITKILINSLITNIEPGQTFNVNQPIKVKGLCWDGGDGIDRVEISIDGGNTWRMAQLKENPGRFSWRQWHYTFQSREKGPLNIMAKATGRKGTTQPMQFIQNPAGYHHNTVQSLTITIV